MRHGAGTVRLRVWADRVIEVCYTASGEKPRAASLTVVGKRADVKWSVVDAGVRTAAVEARVDPATGAVSFVDVATGKTFLAEASNGRAETTTTVGKQTVRGPAQSFVLSPGEAIYGLGQHADGVFNYVGHSVHLQQRNTDIGVPVLLSSAGYLLLWDNPSVTDVDATKASEMRWASEAGDSTDYYVCFGPEPDRAIAGYRQMTGAAPMFGRWAWGLWQSRERYQSQDEILAVAREYRRRQIPIDGVVQDWQYWSPQPWGSHAFGPKFPDPAGLVRDLHSDHFHAIISVWAKFDQGSRNYDELEKAGLLYPPIYPNVYPKGQAKWYDPFNAGARDMYWRQIDQQIGAFGWDGWWLDATEPELGGRWGEYRSLTTAAGPGYAVFNAYPLMTTTAVYDGQRRRKPEERPFILTRSAYAGQQRNGAVSWSGDIAGNWETFRKQVPAGLNFVASGIPYWNTDTGGFFGGDPDDPVYRELFTRWFQFSTFCPMLRVHGTGPHKPLWAFGPEIQKTLVDFDRFRYRLLPYIYSQSWQVTNAGGTMMRPLVMDFRDDPAVKNIGDQYLFGPALMVCPVTEPTGGTLAVVPPASLIDDDGRPGGLSATYFQGEHFDREVARRVDPAIDFEWDKIKREGVGANPRTDPIPGLAMDRFSARWTGSVRTQKAGGYRIQLRADDGMRLWIDGKKVIDDWTSRPAATHSVTVDLPADTSVPIKVEYYQNIADALIDLRWLPPGEPAKEFTRKVYLPAGTWRDFWTGRVVDGGRTIDADAPVERLPLFVRAGSILPLGEAVQYAGERPDGPIELRVYPGRDGSFTMYDDAGDGFGYERGEHAETLIHWDDKAGTLTIGPRSGNYPGMSTKRRFDIVFVDADHGNCPAASSKIDRTIDFDGTAMTVRR